MIETVNIVSPTIQEFLGVRYYLCGRYFQKKGVRLHRKVWEHHNGPIPENHDVHHWTEDRARNQIGDLELKTSKAHHQDHGKSAEHLERFQAAGAKSAAEWHGSVEGRNWHSAHYEKSLREVNAKKVKKVCTACLNEYETTYNKAPTALYCSLNCRQASVRLRAGKPASPKGRRNYPGLYPNPRIGDDHA